VSPKAGFRALRIGFIDQSPDLATAARACRGPTLCLPFFARRNGHVMRDLPEALARGGFAGPLLAPIGEDPEVTALAARAIARCGAGDPAPGPRGG